MSDDVGFLSWSDAVSSAVDMLHDMESIAFTPSVSLSNGDLPEARTDKI